MADRLGREFGQERSTVERPGKAPSLGIDHDRQFTEMRERTERALTTLREQNARDKSDRSFLAQQASQLNSDVKNIPAIQRAIFQHFANRSKNVHVTINRSEMVSKDGRRTSFVRIDVETSSGRQSSGSVALGVRAERYEARSESRTGNARLDEGRALEGKRLTSSAMPNDPPANLPMPRPERDVDRRSSETEQAENRAKADEQPARQHRDREPDLTFDRSEREEIGRAPPTKTPSERSGEAGLDPRLGQSLMGVAGFVTGIGGLHVAASVGLTALGPLGAIGIVLGIAGGAAISVGGLATYLSDRNASQAKAKSQAATLKFALNVSSNFFGLQGSMIGGIAGSVAGADVQKSSATGGEMGKGFGDAVSYSEIAGPLLIPRQLSELDELKTSWDAFSFVVDKLWEPAVDRAVDQTRPEKR